MNNSCFKERLDAFCRDVIEQTESAEFRESMHRGMAAADILAGHPLVNTIITQARDAMLKLPTANAFQFAMGTAVITGFMWGREFGFREGMGERQEIEQLEKLFKMPEAMPAQSEPDPTLPEAA